mgnify:CR=1 FL=1
MYHSQMIDSGDLSPQAIMDKDAYLLDQLDPKGPSILHFYNWNAPCLTFGYFIDPAQHLNEDGLQHYGLQIARRPTGGGIIFHLTDFAFSILIPSSHPRFSLNTLENYVFINKKVARAVAHFTSQSLQPELFVQETQCRSKECVPFCMAKATQYDLMIGGKKVGGAAQRRTKQGLLHQGSLFLFHPPIDLLKKILKNGEVVIENMYRKSDYLLSGPDHFQQLTHARLGLKESLKMAFLDLNN